MWVSIMLFYYFSVCMKKLMIKMRNKRKDSFTALQRFSKQKGECSSGRRQLKLFPHLAGIRLCKKAVSGGGAGKGEHTLLERLLPTRHKDVCFGIPSWHHGKESACQYRRLRRHGFNPWVRKISPRRKWQPTPALLLGKSHGQRGLVGYSP